MTRGVCTSVCFRQPWAAQGDFDRYRGEATISSYLSLNYGFLCMSLRKPYQLCHMVLVCLLLPSIFGFNIRLTSDSLSPHKSLVVTILVFIERSNLESLRLDFILSTTRI